jgi:hypothetical protein
MELIIKIMPRPKGAKNKELKKVQLLKEHNDKNTKSGSKGSK